MRFNYNTASRRRQRGFSLVEIAMVLAIAALIIAGVMLAFSNASNGQKTNDAFSQLAVIQQVVRSLYAGQPNYSGLSIAQLAGSGQLPNKWVNGTGLTNPFNSPVTIASAAGDSNFTITMTGLPTAACSKMATADMGTGVFQTTVGGTVVNGRAMTPNESITACATNGNTITWQFF